MPGTTIPLFHARFVNFLPPLTLIVNRTFFIFYFQTLHSSLLFLIFLHFSKFSLYCQTVSAFWTERIIPLFKLSRKFSRRKNLTQTEKEEIEKKTRKYDATESAENPLPRIFFTKPWYIRDLTQRKRGSVPGGDFRWTCAIWPVDLRGAALGAKCIWGKNNTIYT